jgi:hypothetical protein
MSGPDPIPGCGYTSAIPFADVAPLADALAEGVTVLDVRPNTSTINAEAHAIIGFWPGAELEVTWNFSRIKAGSQIWLTSRTSRIREGVTATSAGTVNLSRSSGSVADEVFDAELGGSV